MKMNFFILGFQRRVWCPKWTPASRSSFMPISATSPPVFVPPPLRSARPPVDTGDRSNGLERVEWRVLPADFDYRFENWNRFRAAACPYFFRSFMRESRV